MKKLEINDSYKINILIFEIKRLNEVKQISCFLLNFRKTCSSTSLSPAFCSSMILVLWIHSGINLRVRAVFHKTVQVCHVYCNFKIGFTCQITIIFGTLKDASLLINTLASNICFSYRKMFQNGVDALSKIVDAFLSKSSKFYLVRIIQWCSNFTSLWHKHLLRNYKWHFRLPMSAFATALWNTLSKNQLFTLNFAFKLFYVSIVIDNCRSQKYHL